VSDKTALYDASVLLHMDGFDDLERSNPEPNPFWNRARFEVAWALPEMAGLLKDGRISLQPMRLATREELLLFHDVSYIETIELFGNSGVAFSSRFGLDTPECPVFQDMHKYVSYPVGAVIDATLAVAEGRFKNAMSFIGGFHHAFESKATGFCYYNDCVIAIKKFKKLYPGKRVLYLDTDVHHGDGTQAAFYDDPEVLTISMHELSMSFFPGTGRPEEMGIGEGKGYSVNIPLPPLTDDGHFLWAFDDVVKPLWYSFKPDLVFWNVGADAHHGDPLADLMLTYSSYGILARKVLKMVNKGNGKLVAVGGGGYNPISAAIVWTAVLSVISGVDIPSEYPEDWIELCQSHGLTVPREDWIDGPTIMNDIHLPGIRRTVSESIEKIKKLVFPIHGL